LVVKARKKSKGFRLSITRLYAESIKYPSAEMSWPKEFVRVNSRSNWTSPRMYKVYPSCVCSYVTYGTSNCVKIYCAANQLFVVVARKFSRKTPCTYVKMKGLNWMKCVEVCTGGARPICCKNSSVVAGVSEVIPNASWTHCNLQREVWET
jgi:hypothetical protein